VGKVSGGVERLSMTGLFADAVESFAAVPLSPPGGAVGGGAFGRGLHRRFLSGRVRRARPKKVIARRRW